MLPINNISFYGRFRYLGSIPGTIDELPFFEVGKNNVSKQLVEFSEKSAFLNRLKLDKDVMLCHYRDLKKPEEQEKKQGFLSGLFSKKRLEKIQSPRLGNDYLTVMFANNKPDNPRDTELCAIQISLPINKDTPDNLDRFENVLRKISDINILRVAADRLFPNSSHKVAPLPNADHGYCEFWTGKRTAGATLDKLFLISQAQIKSIYDKFNENILKTTFG